jgi:hypothetical protein
MAEKRFPDETWEEISSIVASAFAMDSDRSKKLRSNTTAKLIASIPYLAGCRECERTAVAHLATYVVAGHAAAENVFDHNAGDNYDVLARLATIGSFEGGDPAIINRGMKMLARIMIKGYSRDVGEDMVEGKYNPVADGKWNADEKLASLSSSIAAAPDPEMDAIAVEGLAQGWWGRG